MDEFLSVGGCSIKIENEEVLAEFECSTPQPLNECVLKEEYEDDIRGDIIQESVVKQECDYEETNGEEELQLPLLVTLPDNGFVIKEEILEDPLSDITPISDTWIKQECVFFDAEPTSEARGSSLWIESPRTTQEQGYSHKSCVPFKFSCKLEDYKTIECRNKWIQETKDQVEKHIQEVRSYQKLRNTSNEVKRTSNEVKRIRKPRPDQSREVKQESTSKPRKGMKCHVRPPPVGGQEWIRWVREEKARLEQHILEVRESRKCRPVVVQTTKSGNPSEAQYPPNLMDISSRNEEINKDVGSSKLRIVVNGTLEIETSERGGRGRGRGTGRGRGRARSMGGGRRRSQRLLKKSSTSKPVSWT